MNNVLTINNDQIAIITTPVCNDVMVVYTDRHGKFGLSARNPKCDATTMIKLVSKFYTLENILQVLVDEKHKKYIKSAHYQGNESLCAVIVEDGGYKNLKIKTSLQMLNEVGHPINSEDELEI